MSTTIMTSENVEFDPGEFDVILCFVKTQMMTFLKIQLTCVQFLKVIELFLFKKYLKKGIALIYLINQ